MHDNENGPTNVPGKGWCWKTSVYGRRKIAAERAFWTCDGIEFDDVMTVNDWDVNGDIWTRTFTSVTTNRFGDMVPIRLRVHFKPDTAEITGVDGH